jgi:hypothetical protein
MHQHNLNLAGHPRVEPGAGESLTPSSEKSAGRGVAVQGRRTADAASQLRAPARRPRLRDLTRYRADLVGVRTAEKNRVEKLLEDACIKLSVVASDIFGVFRREMMAAMIAGERDPKRLADMARPECGPRWGS